MVASFEEELQNGDVMYWKSLLCAFVWRLFTSSESGSEEKTADGLSVCECRQKNLIKNCSSAKMTIIEPSRLSHKLPLRWCCFHPRKLIQLRFFLVRHLAGENKSCRTNDNHEVFTAEKKFLNSQKEDPTKVNESFYFAAKSFPLQRSVTSRESGKSFPRAESERQGVSVGLSCQQGEWKACKALSLALQAQAS